MTQEVKKRHVAFIRCRAAGLGDIHFEIDLGENTNNVTEDDIVTITQGARLGQYGGDISKYNVQIRPMYTLEEFKEFCDKQRAELEKQQQEKKKKKKRAVEGREFGF